VAEAAPPREPGPRAAAPGGEPETLAAAPQAAKPSIASSGDEVVPPDAIRGDEGAVGDERALDAAPDADGADGDEAEDGEGLMQRIDAAFTESAYVNSRCMLCSLSIAGDGCLLECDHVAHAQCAAMYIGWCAVHRVNPACMVTDARGAACGGLFEVTRSQWDPRKVLWGMNPQAVPPPDMAVVRDAAWCSRKTRSLAWQLYGLSAFATGAALGLMILSFVAVAVGGALAVERLFGPL